MYDQKEFGRVTYESNMPYALRFMIDTHIVGMSWIELKQGTYIVRDNSLHSSKCQYELDVPE